MRMLILFFLLPQLANMSFAQNGDSPLLSELFAQNTNPIFQQVMRGPDKYRLQIQYIQIDRDGENKPIFTTHDFHLDSHHYFNPASTVKLPAALVALEKLNSLPADIDKDTWLAIDSAYEGQTALHNDPSAPDQKATIAHFIKRAFIISENDPYNRLYQFTGQELLNQSLWDKGFTQTRITRQFASFTPEQNRHTNPFHFFDEQKNIIHTVPLAVSNIEFDFIDFPPIGKSHYRSGKLVEGGMDFSQANNLPLSELLRMLQTVIFPESFETAQRFNLSDTDRPFVLQYLSQFPGETNYPKYDKGDFYPSYAKFFFKDSTHRDLPDAVRIFNKVGWAYGFLTDASYIVDFKNGVEFLLAATIYVNESEILNDGKYEYDSVGHPFLYQLGQTIYQHELSRRRENKPDLSEFVINYDRQTTDARPPLKENEVDN